MPGLPRILCLLVVSSLVAGGTGDAANLESENDGKNAPATGSVALTPRAEGPEVDAFF
jgi:hypothetical protein